MNYFRIQRAYGKMRGRTLTGNEGKERYVKIIP
jgi:hypothetical protein